MTSRSITARFAAFSDPTRLRILQILWDGDLCVGDVVTLLHLPQPKVSRHLAYLRRAGLVTTQKRGLWIFYALAPALTRGHQKMLECLEACFADVPELRADRRRAQRLRKRGGCCPITPD